MACSPRVLFYVRRRGAIESPFSDADSRGAPQERTAGPCHTHPGAGLSGRRRHLGGAGDHRGRVPGRCVLSADPGRGARTNPLHEPAAAETPPTVRPPGRRRPCLHSRSERASAARPESGRGDVLRKIPTPGFPRAPERPLPSALRLAGRCCGVDAAHARPGQPSAGPSPCGRAKTADPGVRAGAPGRDRAGAGVSDPAGVREADPGRAPGRTRAQCRSRAARDLGYAARARAAARRASSPATRHTSGRVPPLARDAPGSSRCSAHAAVRQLHDPAGGRMGGGPPGRAHRRRQRQPWWRPNDDDAGFPGWGRAPGPGGGGVASPRGPRCAGSPASSPPSSAFTSSSSTDAPRTGSAASRRPAYTIGSWRTSLRCLR